MTEVAPVENLEARRSAFRLALARAELDACVVTSLPNVAYLTGLFASAASLVITSTRCVVISDARYATALRARADADPGLTAMELATSGSYDAALVEVLQGLAGARVGFEAAHLTVARHRTLLAQLGGEEWEAAFVPTEGLVEGLRVRKDAWEIACLREGGARLSDVAKCIIPRILAGRFESEVAGDVDRELRHAGFARPAFDTIVASGPNAALPHARPGARRIEAGDLVVLDCGGVFHGYCTDLTRTVVVGRAGDRERRLIEQVKEAQRAAFAAVAPGAAPEGVDAAAREVFGRHGIAEAFTHGTGHGLGLEVHEAPRVTRARAGGAEPLLASGMVLTLEPGAYFPGWGGARREDDVLVTESGAEWLTHDASSS